MVIGGTELCRGDSATRRPPPPVKAVRVCSLVCGPVEKTHSITFLTDSPADAIGCRAAIAHAVRSTRGRARAT